MSKKIEKKIAELMSEYGCPFGDPVYSKYRPIEKLCLFLSRWYYKLTSGLFYKTKYFIQRRTRGYDDLDKWNVAWYIARKAIPVLKDMKENVIGTSIKWHREDRFGNITELTRDEVFTDVEHPDDHPAAFTLDEWQAILDDIIFAFQYVLDQDIYELEYDRAKHEANYKRHKRGLKLFSIYYMNLWD